MTFDISGVWSKLLSEGPVTDGWRAIRVAPEAVCPIRAAIEHPSNAPALLVDLSSSALKTVVRLPSAKGFSTNRMPIGNVAGDVERVTISLLEPGHREEFAIFVNDIVGSVARAKTEEEAVSVLLAKIHQWQRFLQERGGPLSVERQTGLMAELLLLQDYCQKLGAVAALNAWKGPFRSLRDFRFGDCDIEVKATSGTSTLVHVSHLEQLDEKDVAALFMYHVAFVDTEEGISLPEQVDRLSSHIGENSTALEVEFQKLLAAAGYNSEDRPIYETRRLVARTSKYYKIEGAFPRISRKNVAAAIRDASYEFDVSLCSEYEVGSEIVDGVIGGSGGWNGS